MGLRTIGLAATGLRTTGFVSSFRAAIFFVALCLILFWADAGKKVRSVRTAVAAMRRYAMRELVSMDRTIFGTVGVPSDNCDHPPHREVGIRCFRRCLRAAHK